MNCPCHGLIRSFASGPAEERDISENMFIFQVLIVQLKRFYYTRKRRGKIRALVDFDPEGVDLQPWCSEGSAHTAMRLFGVVNHSGDLGCGHYTAAARPSSENALGRDAEEWHLFNDASCHQIPRERLVTQDAYMLFYALDGARARALGDPDEQPVLVDREAKAALLRFFYTADVSGDGLVPGSEVRRLVLAAGARADHFTAAAISDFSMPCGQRVRYREVGDWLIPEVECASVPPGLTDALGRARKLHAERAASAAEAERGQLEFSLVRALGHPELERAGSAREVAMSLPRSGGVLEKLVDVIPGMAEELTWAQAATAGEMNSKFAGEPGSFCFSHGTRSDFFGGVEDLIGSPDPRVERAMMREHCNAEDSAVEWKIQNYGATTTPEKEWHFMAGDARSKWKWPEETATQRLCQRGGIGDFKEVFEGINAKLRGKGGQAERVKKFHDLCRGNRCCTTIHTINSAPVKLSKLEKAGKLYLGTQLGVLPACFWNEAEAVAQQYAQGGDAQAAAIFEIQTGMIDRGADLAPISQRPRGEEICCPLPACAEVVGSRTQGGIPCIQARLNVNFSALTIDQVIDKRKRLVTDMCKGLVSEVSTAVARYQWATVGQYSALEAGARQKTAAEHFNDDEKLLNSIRTALEITDSVKLMASSVLREAAEHLKRAGLAAAAARAERRAAGGSIVESKELAPITLKRGGAKRLGLTQGSDRLRIVDAEIARGAARFDRLVLETAGALALGPHRNSFLIHGAGLGAGAGEIPARASGSKNAIKDAVLSTNSLGGAPNATGEMLLQNQTLKNLRIDGNDLGSVGGPQMAEALKGNDALHSPRTNMRLQALNTEFNDLDGVESIAIALETNVTLQHLRIPQNELGEGGGRALAKASRSNRALERLGIAKNEIIFYAGAEIADAAKGNARLKTPRIGGNELGPRAFAEAPRFNGSLSTLELSGNSLQAEAAIAIARPLRPATRTLARLGMVKSEIGAECLRALAGAHGENASLEVLEAHGNGIGPREGEFSGRALGKNGCIAKVKLGGVELSGEAVHLASDEDVANAQRLPEQVREVLDKALPVARLGFEADASSRSARVGPAPMPRGLPAGLAEGAAAGAPARPR
ncbi:unnamed protein product [Prorocentrum cordatum]|uniref:USP domain-containing protein n=1 Tax=Prorocentrum cordatum TaxID=2364126 RepID=A0ABN9Q7U8_9DINO|nr:unnamed protein product [Polarella glacialis]